MSFSAWQEPSTEAPPGGAVLPGPPCPRGRDVACAVGSALAGEVGRAPSAVWAVPSGTCPREALVSWSHLPRDQLCPRCGEARGGVGADELRPWQREWAARAAGTAARQSVSLSGPLECGWVWR